MTEKELEKLFKSKLDNREFAFNPANWEAMEAMLDTQPQPAGAFYWRSVAAVLLFAVGVWSLITFTDVAGPQHNIAHQEKSQLENNTNGNVGTIGTEIQTENQDQNVDEGGVPHEVEKVIIEENFPSEENNAQIATSEPKSSKVQRFKESIISEVGKVAPQNFSALDLKEINYQYNLEAPQGATRSSGLSIVSWNNESLKKFEQKKSFYLEVAPVFTGSQNANNVGFGWEAGIGFQQEFENRFVVSAGLNYLVISGVNISNKSDSVFYNFGREVVQTEEINKRLDYIEVPVSIGYKLNEKHSLHLGAYAGFLVSVSQEVNKETSGFKTETKTETLENSGYQEGFNRWDAGVSFGYRYRLNPSLSVGLHYNLGLKDITNDASGGDYQLTHTNQSTRVIFRYSLF